MIGAIEMTGIEAEQCWLNAVDQRTVSIQKIRTGQVVWCQMFGDAENAT